MILVDKESDESIKKADFVVTDSEDEEVGEITFDSSKKKKFEANSDFFEWNQIVFYSGGELDRKQDLVKDAKNGNSPSRDLNNYNDLIDVQEDGVVGNHVDFPEQGASGASVSFADGGDISFLNDVDKFFDEGGSTGGSEKPNVDLVKIVKTHATTAGVDKYQGLVGKMFIDWTSLKTELRKVFKEQGKFIGAFTIEINDNQKAKIFIKFDDKKNTVANFNPLTGVFSDFKKQALRNQPTTFNSFDWNDFQSSNNKQQESTTQGSESNDAPSSAKPVLEYVVVTNDSRFPKLKDVNISSLFEFYNILLDSVKENDLELFATYFRTKREGFLTNIFFRKEGTGDFNTFITDGTTFEDFKSFFLKLPVYEDGKAFDTVSGVFDTDKFIGSKTEAKSGEAKSSDKEVVKSLVVYEILGNQKDSKDIVGFPRYEIDAFYSLLKDFAEKHKDCNAVRVEINAVYSQSHRFTIAINEDKFGNRYFDFETKNLDDFKKYILMRFDYESEIDLKENFDFTSFFGEDSEKPSAKATSPFKDILEYVEVTNNMTFPKLKDVKIKSLLWLYNSLLENTEPFLQYFRTVFRLDNNRNFIKDIWFKTEGADVDTFITTGTTFEDFKKFFLQLAVNNNGVEGSINDLVNADKFIGTENGAKAGESKSSEKQPLKYVELLGSPKNTTLFDIFDLQTSVNSLVNKNDTLQIFETYLNGNDSDLLTFFARKTGSQDDDTFVTTGKSTDDFIKFFTNLSLKKGGKLTDKFNLDIFLGIGKVNKISYAFNKKDRQVDSGFVFSSKEYLDKVKEAWDTGVVFNDAVLFVNTPVIENVSRNGLTRLLYISNKPKENPITFNPEKESLQDLENLLQNKWVGNSGSKNNERLDWSEFFGTKTDEQSSSTKPVLEYVEILNARIFKILKDVKITSLSQLYDTLLEKSVGSLNYFDTLFKIDNGKSFSKNIWFSTKGSSDDETFITTGTIFEDFKKFFLQLPINNNGENGLLDNLLNADKFVGEESKQPTEEPKEESKPQETVDFEIERKYLFTRINALSKELDFKRPSLTNEEIGFYSREINKLVLRLRKVTEKQESLKPISERLKAIYSVKWGDYGKEYPETTLMSVNGSKSELTESEYQVVRNFEFKSFFGDWEKAYLEKNPSSASQIVNPKTMEPMAVYHGTDVLFTDWKTYATNNAHYFSKKRSFANWFASSWEDRSDKAGVDSKILKQLNPNKGKFVYRCFLDIRKPVDFSRFGVEKRPVKEFLVFLKINYGIGDYDFWTGLGNASAVTAETPVFAWQIIRLWQNFTMYIKAYTTYDGYIFYEYNPDTPSGGLDNASLCFCAFESSQVKFTEAYEFSALSNDSRFDLGGEL
jgi:hypothetical protein